MRELGGREQIKRNSGLEIVKFGRRCLKTEDSNLMFPCTFSALKTTEKLLKRLSLTVVKTGTVIDMINAYASINAHPHFL